MGWTRKRSLAAALFSAVVSVWVLPDISAAQSKIRSTATPTVAIDPSRFGQTTFAGKTIYCYLTPAGRVLVGKPNSQKTQFTPDVLNTLLAPLKKKLKAANSSAKAKIKKKIAKLKADFEKKTTACGQIFGISPSPTPTGSSTPPPSNPIIEAESLDPIDRVPTNEDIRYLVEKAGFGGYDAGLQALAPQGIDAVVREFMRDKADPADLTALVKNWNDDVLNNPEGAASPSPSPQVPSVTGTRKSLLVWTLLSPNSFRMRLMHFFMNVFSVNGCRLAAAGGTANYGANPRQEGVYWDYLKILHIGARYPSLPDLVRDASQSVAMLISHRNAGSLPDGPNENFAQELLDRMTIGPTRTNESGAEIANYTRNMYDGAKRTDDLGVIARRLTGWSVSLVATGVGNEQIWAGRVTDANHAKGPETVFAGQSYAFSADTDNDVIQGLFAKHPAAAEHWSRMLLQEFVTPNPSLNLVRNFAAEIKAANFNLEAPLLKLLKSKAFFYAGYRDTVPKNPLEVLVEGIKLLNMPGIFSDVSVLATHQARINSLIGWVVNTPKTSANPAGMGFDFACPPAPNFYSRDRYANGGAVAANIQFLGRIIGQAITQDPLPPGTPSGVWRVSDGFLPQGAFSVDQLVQILAPYFGVEVSAQQLDEIHFFMDFSINPTGINEYNNLLEGTTVLHRRGKGMALALMLMGYPGFAMR